LRNPINIEAVGARCTELEKILVRIPAFSYTCSSNRETSSFSADEAHAVWNNSCDFVGVWGMRDLRRKIEVRRIPDSTIDKILSQRPELWMIVDLVREEPEYEYLLAEFYLSGENRLSDSETDDLLLCKAA
jgi:hypothetical protein